MIGENYKLETHHSTYDINSYNEMYDKIKKNYTIYNFEKDSLGNSIGVVKDGNNDIIFCFEYYYTGIKPKMFLCLETDILLIGASCNVICLNTKSKEIVNIFSNGYSLFFEFLKAENRIIILFELEAYAVNFRSDIVWQTSFPDIIIDYNIEKDTFIVKTDNNLKICYSIENGKIIWSKTIT